MSDQIRYDIKPLNDFVNGLKSKYVVRVGIFGDKNSRFKTNLTNAEIGALNEFGSITKKIPKRSFLRLPLFLKTDVILKETSVGIMPLLKKGNMQMVLKRLGIACENAIQKAFASRGYGKWKPNAPLTIALKGSSQPLIDTSQLRRSISSKVTDASS